MPFNIGISGLNAATADLKVTGNNIANASTVGFKSSRAEFANIYSTSKFGASSTAIGSGVRVAAVAQQFTQGNISFTENNMDVAVNGDGFFNIKDQSGAELFTRNGQFKVDKNGFIVTNDGYNLQGFQVSETDNQLIDTGNVGDLKLTTAQIEPKQTSTSSLIANLDAADEIPATPFAYATGDTNANPPVVVPPSPDMYNHTTSYTSYDSLGNSMLTSMYFVKTADNAWDVHSYTTDAMGIVADSGPTLAITFDTDGSILTPDPPEMPMALTPTGGADPAQAVVLNLSDLTQYGADFNIGDISQNGYTTGNLAGIDIGSDGIILARYSNGESNYLGQVILSGFTNSQGLGQQGNNNWSETFASGDPITNIPGGGGLGLLTSGALEESNTDLTEELINLIIAQRNFQANAKTITTADTITQTVIQM
jgi:flagellar hook protein FlgE